jgi:hypothetical protein
LQINGQGQNKMSLAFFVDEISARYGWTDDYIYDLAYSRFIEIVELIFEKKQEEEKKDYVQSAFVGWQYIMTQTTQNLPFQKYLEKLGLLRKTKEQKMLEKKKMKQEAEDIIKQITEAFK